MARFRNPYSRRDDLQRLRELAPSEPHPGGWGEDLIWKGPHGWFTRHGLSTLIWDGGKPWWVLDGLRENGDRVEVQGLGGRKPNWRRPKHPPESYIFCDIEVSEHDILVTDLNYPAPSGPDDALDQFVMENEVLVKAIRNDFCYCLVFSILISNRNWWKDGIIVRTSGDSGGSLCASIRNTGNLIQDFHFISHEDFILEGSDRWPDEKEIIKLINSGGWYEYLDEGYERNATEVQQFLRELFGPPSGWTKIDSGWIQTG
jgi:hypothetical protein